MGATCVGPNVPVGQSLHVEEELAAVTVPNLPMPHSAHEVAPVTLLKDPGEQAVHVEEPPLEEYLPVGHSPQVEGGVMQYSPGPQAQGENANSNPLAVVEPSDRHTTASDEPEFKVTAGGVDVPQYLVPPSISI